LYVILLLNAKKQAYKYEKFTDIIKIYGLEIKLLRIENNLELLKKHSEEIFGHIQEVLEKISNNLIYEKQYVSIIKKNKEIELVRNITELQELDQIINNSMFVDENKAISIRSKITYNYILGVYYYFIHEFEDSFKYFSRHLELLEKNKDIRDDLMPSYVRSLKNYLFLSFKLNQYDNFEKKIPVFNVLKTNSKSLQENINYSSYMFNIMYHTETGKFNKAVEYIEENEQKMQEMSRKGNFYEESIFVWFKSSVAYFGIGNFRKSLRIINEYINSSPDDIKMDSLCMAKIYTLVVHYELQNFDLLEYSVLSTIRFLKKKERLYEFEKIILRFISQSFVVSDKKEMTKAFTKLLIELKQLKENKFEQNVFEYFDYILWLKSKIEGKDFAKQISQHIVILNSKK